MKTAKKLALLLSLMPLLLMADIWVHGDSVGVNMKSYGELEVWGPVIPNDTTKQVDRISLLVGTTDGNVFDYYEDADIDIYQALVEEPALSDMEGFTSINNYYSDLPPDVHAAISPYAWTDAEYVIIKVVITNVGSAAFDARFGLDIISQIAGDYDGVHNWLPDSDIIDMTREGENHVGLKFLSHDMVSLSQFIWFSGYSSAGEDDALWAWMTATETDTTVVCDNPDDGVVSIPSTDLVHLEVDESVPFFYAITRGQTQEAMVANMVAAEAAYADIFTVSTDPVAELPMRTTLSQNYPNPFNPSTEIRYQLVEAGQVSLDIYDISGKHVMNLHTGFSAAGDHGITINTAGLSSGVYIYRLTTGNDVLQHKMTLLK